MSEAQDAFRATIELGYYPKGRDRSSYYMCVALEEAHYAGVITEDQCEAGITAISRALAGRGFSMASVILGRHTTWEEDRDWAIEHGVDLYMNWDERVPTLKFPEWSED